MSRLTNKDFRSFVNQSNKNDITESNKPQKDLNLNISAKEKHKLRYLQILKRQKQRVRTKDHSLDLYSNDDDDVDSLNVGFRDRAAERREQEAKESRQGPQATTVAVLKPLQNITEEESKYLGGDVEHTHLVKGLDYVLLNKTRSELEQKEAEKKISAATTITDRLEPTLSVDPKIAALTRRICTELVKNIHPHHIQFTKRLDRVDSVILQGGRFRDNPKNFLPGKMVYQFDLLNKSAATPTIVTQSSAHSDTTLHNGCIAPIHWRIAKHIGDILPTGIKKKSKNRNVNNIPTTTVPRLYIQELQDFEKYLAQFKPFSPIIDVPVWKADSSSDKKSESGVYDDEDIFADVGTYDPSKVPLDTESTDESNKLIYEDGPKSYFETTDTVEKIDRIEKMSSLSATTSSLINSVVEKQALSSIPNAIKKGIHSNKQSNSANDYEECYPGVIEFNDFSDDEDDEIEGKKKKRKGDTTEVPADKKKPKLTARSVRRQTEREWKKLEGFIESKSHRDLNSLEEHIHKKSNAPSSFPNVV